MSGIRIENDTHEAALVAALTALYPICEPKRPRYRHHRRWRSIVVQGNQGLGLGGQQGKGAACFAFSFPLGDPPPPAILDQGAAGPGTERVRGAVLLSTFGKRT